MRLADLPPHPCKTRNGPQLTSVCSQQKGPPEIELDELVYDENRDFLGEGTFGKVYKYVTFRAHLGAHLPTFYVAFPYTYSEITM